METQTQTALVPIEITQVLTPLALPNDDSQKLIDTFSPLFIKAQDLKAKASGLVVKDASQKLEMKLAREYRLALKQIRLEGDNTHEKLKANALTYGRACDGMRAVLRLVTSEMETHLEAQEKFVEIQEQKRKTELKAQRLEVLSAYPEFSAVGYNLEEMPVESFDLLISGLDAKRREKIEAEQKAERERLEREKAEAEERARIKAENERLKAEAEEREKKAAEERAEAERVLAEERRKNAEAEAKAKAEREKDEAYAEAIRAKEREEQAKKEAEAKAERERIEAELRAEKEKAAKLEAERLAEIARQEAEAKARAKAPDKEKLLAFAMEIDALYAPDVSTLELGAVAENVNGLLRKVSAYIRTSVEK